jgi:hypothetical protein
VQLTRVPRLYEEVILQWREEEPRLTTGAIVGHIWNKLWAGGTDSLSGITTRPVCSARVMGSQNYLGDGTNSRATISVTAQWVYLSLNEMYLMMTRQTS